MTKLSLIVFYAIFTLLAFFELFVAVTSLARSVPTRIDAFLISAMCFTLSVTIYKELQTYDNE